MSWINNGMLAGFFAALTVYYASASVLMLYLIWLYRRRFYCFFDLPLRDKADTFFNIWFVILLSGGALSRYKATEGYAEQFWKVSAFNIDSAAQHIPMMAATLGILCWLCIVIFDKRYFLGWATLVVSGAALGFAVYWRF